MRKGTAFIRILLESSHSIVEHLKNGKDKF